MVSSILCLEKMKRPKIEFRYENRMELYLIGQPHDAFKNMNYRLMEKREWLLTYDKKETNAIEWFERNSNKLNRTTALKDFSNIQSLFLQEKINLYIEKSGESPTFIALEKRVQLDEENNVSNEVVVNAIVFVWDNKGVISIEYITRFFQGIVFQFEVEKKQFTQYEKFPIDGLFSFVMEQVKKIPDTTTIIIQIVSEGSKRLIQNHLLSTYFKKDTHKLPVVNDTDKQMFPLEYLQFRLCSQCMNNISTLIWEKQDKYAFCSRQCAQNKWNSLN